GLTRRGKELQRNVQPELSQAQQRGEHFTSTQRIDRRKSEDLDVVDIPWAPAHDHDTALGQPGAVDGTAPGKIGAVGSTGIAARAKGQMADPKADLARRGHPTVARFETHRVVELIQLTSQDQ